MGTIRNEFAPLGERARRDNWVAESTVTVVKTLIVGFVASMLVPYVLNSILSKAGMLPNAGAVPGFLIGAAIINWTRLGRMWVVVALAIIMYLVNLEMVTAVQLTIENLMGSALD